MKQYNRRIIDLIFRGIVVILSILAIAPLFAIMASVLIYGGRVLLKAGLGFLYELPPSPLSQSVGGIGPSLLGTLILMILTIIIGLPLSFFTAVLAVEYPNNIFSKIIRILVRSFIEIPTILISILIYTIIVMPMGRFSALAGALALAIVSLPYMYTHMERALSSIPWIYREAAYGLGLSKFNAVFKIFLGIARRGVLAGALVGLAKASGETAPLMFTIGSSRHTYFSGLDQPIDAIPLLIYEFAQTPYRIYHDVAWGAALILLLIFIIVFAVLRIIVKEVKL